MASTNKTANLDLNQWSLSDKPEMADFNADNTKIDTAVSAHLAENVLTSGGAHGLEVSLGSFTPILSAETTNPTVTYSIQRGRYYKIGKLVAYHFLLRFTASGGSGIVNVSVPFPFGQNDEFGIIGRSKIGTSTLAQTAMYNSGAGVSVVRFLDNNSVTLYMPTINTGATVDLAGSIVYEAQ
jgi:hypothetical protein